MNSNNKNLDNLETETDVVAENTDITRKKRFNLPDKKISVILLVTALIILTVGWLVIPQNKNSDTVSTSINAEISITQEGFSTQQVNISSGSVVVWNNESGAERRLVAGPYPSGESLPEFDLKSAISEGDEYSFVFNDAGEYEIYDFNDPSKYKMLVVVR